MFDLCCRDDVSQEIIDHIASMVIAFIQAAVKCFPLDVEEDTSLASAAVKLCTCFLDSLTSIADERALDLTTTCVYAEQVKGLLNFSAKCSAESSSSVIRSEADVEQYMTLLVFTVTLMSRLPETWDDGEDEEKKLQTISSEDIRHLKDSLLSIIYAVGICESFSRHYKSVSIDMI